MATRRRRGEDGISFEHRGPAATRTATGTARAGGAARSVGCTGDGKRTRRKVRGTTKASVVDKLRDLHLQLDKGITPKAGYACAYPKSVTCMLATDASKGLRRRISVPGGAAAAPLMSNATARTR